MNDANAASRPCIPSLGQKPHVDQGYRPGFTPAPTACLSPERPGGIVARPLELDEVVEHFTSQPGELELLRGMAEATRAGLRPDAEVPELDGARFPRDRG